MRNRRAMLAVTILMATSGWAAANEQATTIASAETVLKEIMATPEKQIPTSLLADAQGVAIVPSVIKIGFIAGVRRGKGVVITRDRDGAWGLPQFVTLTGGSLGWQAGAQSTDVVLVFRTQSSVEGLKKGKFTIGADAEAAAGPVGRRIEAATDVQLKAEIYAYSRSRGLFAGVALDGSALQIDQAAHQAYYGGPPAQPAQVPEGAVELVQYVATLAAVAPDGAQARQPAIQPQQQPTFVQPAPAQPALAQPSQGQPLGGGGALVSVVPPQTELRRRELAESARQLYPLLDDEWRRFLGLPAEALTGAHAPSADAVAVAVKRFDAVATGAAYRPLAERAEFRATHDALKRYAASLQAELSPKLALPPPPER